jgi:hypothetical protein
LYLSGIYKHVEMGIYCTNNESKTVVLLKVASLFTSSAYRVYKDNHAKGRNGRTYLLETEVSGSLTEALSANVEGVLPNDGMTIAANAAEDEDESDTHEKQHTIGGYQHRSSLGECSTNLSYRLALETGRKVKKFLLL